MTTNKIDDLLDSEGITEDCKGCEFLNEWTEWHPYGSTVAGEDMAECLCHDDNLCQRLNKD